MSKLMSRKLFLLFKRSHDSLIKKKKVMTLFKKLIIYCLVLRVSF